VHKSGRKVRLGHLQTCHFLRRPGRIRTCGPRIRSPKTHVLACPRVSGNRPYLCGFWRSACFSLSVLFGSVLARLQYSCSKCWTPADTICNLLIVWRAVRLGAAKRSAWEVAGYTVVLLGRASLFFSEPCGWTMVTSFRSSAARASTALISAPMSTISPVT
jgi:hypothetical protein